MFILQAWPRSLSLDFEQTDLVRIEHRVTTVKSAAMNHPAMLSIGGSTLNTVWVGMCRLDPATLSPYLVRMNFATLN